MMGEILGNVWGRRLTICHHQNDKWRLPKISTYKLNVYENHESQDVRGPSREHPGNFATVATGQSTQIR